MEAKDYVIRLIRRIIILSARMLRLIDDKKYQQAGELINQELEDLTGLPLHLLEKADAPFLTHMLSLNAYPEQVLLVARLYTFKARITEELGDPIEARRFYIIAHDCLSLVDKAFTDDKMQELFDQLCKDLAYQLSV